MTLKEFIENFKIIAANIPNVGYVGVGDIYELNEQPNITYPSIVLTQDSHYMDVNEDKYNFSFNLFYVERLLEDKSNEIDAQSVATDTLKRLIQDLEDLGVIVITNYDFHTFTERFNSLCCGAYVHVTFVTDNSDCEWTSIVDYIEEKFKAKFDALTNRVAELEEKVEDLTERVDMLEEGSGYYDVEITLSDGTTQIDTYEDGIIPNSAYYNNEDIASVEIGKCIRTIGNSAFYGCSSLTSITIPNSVTSIGNHSFLNCSGLTSVTIPNSVTSIGQSAFYLCKSLTSITIPNSVTSIGNYAFGECTSLTSVIIGSGITSIGQIAFSNCKKLTSITCNASTEPTLGTSVFNKLPQNGTLKTPNSEDNWTNWLTQLPSGWTQDY